jgi:hypothetical protein
MYILESFTLEVLKEAANEFPIYLDKQESKMRIILHQKNEIFIIHIYEKIESDSLRFDIVTDYSSITFPHKKLIKDIINKVQEYVRKTIEKDLKWRLIMITSDIDRIFDVPQPFYSDIHGRIRAENEVGKGLEKLKQDYFLTDEELNEILN